MRESLLESFPILELLQDCCDPPLTRESIEELEIVVGVRFPQDYHEFLSQFNGGTFYRDVRFDIPNPTKFVTGAHVNCLYGEPGDGLEQGGLTWCAEVLSDRLPEDCLAIADCNGSDLVVLKFEPDKSAFAGIWFWDHDAFWVGEDTPAFYWLADSFNEFLSMLVYDVCSDEREQEILPLFQSIERGNFQAVKQYLACGGEVEARNASGHSLLTAAVIHSWPRIVRLLLDSSADPNARDLRGCTPLHHAATHSIDSVKLLLAAGADATARDNKGKSVLRAWSYRADQILIAHGARK